MKTPATERADTLAWIDGKIAACRRMGEEDSNARRCLGELRDEIAAGQHERTNDA